MSDVPCPSPTPHHKARVVFLFSGLFLTSPVCLPFLHPGATGTSHSVHLIFVPSHAGPHQEGSGPSPGPQNGCIIPASTALATSCQMGAVVSCFGMAPTWPCAPQGGKSWGRCLLGGQTLPLPFFSPQVFKHLLCTPTGTHCLVGEEQ